jgi:6-phosphogluconolactonase (cycloisomerase 2 family)
VANYVSGTVAVLPIKDDGSLGEAVDSHQDQGPAGAPGGGRRGALPSAIITARMPI